MNDLTSRLNKAAAGVDLPKVNKASGGARVTNRSITCSEELRNRIRIMAAHKGVPMQQLLESWIRENLEKAGF